MLFHPQHTVLNDGCLILPQTLQATAHPCLDTAILKEFWHNFSTGCSTLTVSPCEEYRFSFGTAPALPPNGWDYTIRVTPEGVCVSASGKAQLIRGMMTLLDRVRILDTEDGPVAALDCCELADTPKIGLRMIHFCVFAETTLWELQRFIRLCGALKYTHLVLEFWGSLRYDCMAELSWPHGFTKEQIKPLIREAKELGLEIIPMFNHWGHASAGRVVHGKHVVLDQNPALQTYFSEDGWCWDIQKPKVKALLRQIRRELCELCGEGAYFHIGCDEAYNFDLTDTRSMDAICDYLNETAEELRREGRQAIVWGDMFLYRHPYYHTGNRYTCNAPTAQSEAYLLDRLSKDILIADWQYNAPVAPVETSAIFTDRGFSCLLCPWDRGIKELSAALETVQEQHLFGVMHTTWHTLTKGMPYVVMAAVGAYDGAELQTNMPYRTGAAALIRKIMPCGGDYKKAGWADYDIGVVW